MSATKVPEGKGAAGARAARAAGVRGIGYADALSHPGCIPAARAGSGAVSLDPT
jgi:hypothetical protein